MTISVPNPVLQTCVFATLLAAAFLISVQIKKTNRFFAVAQTQELKGLAILFVIFGHLGYFLSTDPRFLFPLSIVAGVGVDMFLFLSGFGLTASALSKGFSRLGFYKKNLLKLFVPFWASLAVFLSLDYFFLRISYPAKFIHEALLGFFPSADIYKDLNSPLWYFTLILFYYLVFPLFFSKKLPWLSAIGIFLTSAIILHQHFPQLDWVQPFYKIHLAAFPLGMVIAWLIYRAVPHWASSHAAYAAKSKRLFEHTAVRYAAVVLLLFVAGYISYYFGGETNANIAQLISIAAMLAITGAVLLKTVEFRLLQLFGIYSYEIYLTHWPIVYRYDFLYRFFPAWLATLGYLAFFILVGFAFQKVSKYIVGFLERIFKMQKSAVV
jgi:peptidoglycan/LPS O-acetylase OafA/YrhL